jgi:hypothetical protein
MVTAILVLLFVALIVAAGEAVRGQCRRMLSRPLAAHAPAVMTARVAEPVPHELAA